MTQRKSDPLDELIQRVRAERLTYLTRAKLAVLATTCQRALSACRGGILVEAGCALGGSAIVLAGVKPADTALQLYDTFEGIPAPGPEDGPDVHERYEKIQSGTSEGIGGDEYYGYNDDLLGYVVESFDRFGYSVDTNQVELVVGDLRQTLTGQGPPIAFAHIDVDWFESTISALDAIFPRLLPGGAIVVDDYGDWSGCRTAVDQFLAKHPAARMHPTGLGSVVIEGAPFPANPTSPTELLESSESKRKSAERRASLTHTRMLTSQVREQVAGARAVANLMAQYGAAGGTENLLIAMSEAGHTNEATRLATAIEQGDLADGVRRSRERRHGRTVAGQDQNQTRTYAVLQQAAASGDADALVELSGNIETARADLAKVVTPKPTMGDGTPRIGIYTYQAPSFGRSSRNMGDYIQTLAMMANIARWDLADGVHCTDPAVQQIFADLQSAIPAESRRPQSGALELVPVARDSAVAEPQTGPVWLPLFGWFMHHVRVPEFAFPPPQPFEAIPIAIHVAHEALLDQPGTADYLRSIGPVGCRDWSTVVMCRARGIPAFFAGCTTTTLNLLGAMSNKSGGGRLAVDAMPAVMRAAGLDPDAVDQFAAQEEDRIAVDDFGTNLKRALNRLRTFARADEVITRRLHCHLPAMALGTDSTMLFRRVAGALDVSGDPRFDGLIPLDADGVAEMSDCIQTLYESVFGAILQGAGVVEVRRIWREVTMPLVQAADEELGRRRSQLPVPLISAAPGANSRGPSSPADADRVDVVVAFDERLAAVARVALFSVVNNCSLPVKIHLLGRGLAATRTVEFLEKLDCEYQVIDTSERVFKGARLLDHIASMSTMDRLAIPSLVPDLSQVVYLDVDILVQGDIAELSSYLSPVDRVAARPMDAALGALHEEIKRRTEKLPLSAAVNLRSWLLESAVPVWSTNFNAGVLVMNLDRFRTEDFEKLLPAIDEFHLHDQDILNIYGAGATSPLPANWNVVPGRETVRGAKLIHYAGPRKPWNDVRVDGRSEWLAVAEEMRTKTGFGWQDAAVQ